MEAIKKIEREDPGVSEEVKAEILKNEKHASTIFGRNRPYFNLNGGTRIPVKSAQKTETLEATSQSWKI